MTNGPTRRRITGVLLAAAAGATMLATPATALAAPGSPDNCTQVLYEINQFGTKIFASAERFCTPDPNEPVPATVTLMVEVGAGAKSLGTGLGQVSYQCTGTGKRTYFIGQRPTVRLTTNCS